MKHPILFLLMIGLQFIVVLKTNAQVKNDTIAFSAVDDTLNKSPQFPGGNLDMYKFLKNNLVYPQSESISSIYGKVFVAFIVDKDGSIQSIEIKKSLHPLLDTAVIDAIKKMPRWIPARQNGENVSYKYLFPVQFNLR